MIFPAPFSSGSFQLILIFPYFSQIFGTFFPQSLHLESPGTPSGLGHRGTRARCPEFLGHLGQWMNAHFSFMDHMRILKKMPQKYASAKLACHECELTFIATPTVVMSFAQMVVTCYSNCTRCSPIK